MLGNSRISQWAHAQPNKELAHSKHQGQFISLCLRVLGHESKLIPDDTLLLLAAYTKTMLCSHKQRCFIQMWTEDRRLWLFIIDSLRYWFAATGSGKSGEKRENKAEQQGNPLTCGSPALFLVSLFWLHLDHSSEKSWFSQLTIFKWPVVCPKNSWAAGSKFPVIKQKFSSISCKFPEPMNWTEQLQCWRN